MNRNRFSAVVIPDVGDARTTRTLPTMVAAEATGRSEATLIFRTVPEVNEIEVAVLEGREAIKNVIIRRTK